MNQIEKSNEHNEQWRAKHQHSHTDHALSLIFTIWVWAHAERDRVSVLVGWLVVWLSVIGQQQRPNQPGEVANQPDRLVAQWSVWL